MLRRRSATPALGCAIAIALGAVASGCASEAAGEPRREGLAIPLGGVTYNVYITRQLNLDDPEDRGYSELPEAPPGFTYYGVFLEACNESDEPLRTASSFHIEDQQGDEFSPVALEPDNPFAYRPTTLAPDTCIPEAGSLPALGPTGGALLVFEIPLDATENRPLELAISQGFDPETAGPRQLLFELDI